MNQNILVQLANESDLVKDYLGVPKDFKNITKITANSVHRQVGENQFAGSFVGKRKYKDHVTTNQLIRLAGGGVWEFLKRKYGETRLWEEFYDVPYFKPSLLKYDSGSFNPNSGSGGANTSVDGMFTTSHAAGDTWTVLQTGDNIAVDMTTASTYMYLAAGGTTNKWTNLYRPFFNFDTSSIGAGKKIDSGTATFQGSGTKNDDLSQSIVLAGQDSASDNVFVNADWGTIVRTDYATAQIAVSAWDGVEVFTLNQDGKDSIAMEGVSKYSLLFDMDFDNVENWSSGYEQATVKFADNGADEPQLDLVWSEAATGYKNLLLLGIG